MPPPVIDTDAVIDFMTDGYWAGGASLVLTYSAGGNSWSGYAPGEEPTAPGYSVFNLTQRTAFIAGMELWDSYVAAEFNPASGPGAIRVAFTGIADDGVWGYAYLPGSGQSAATRNWTGDIWVDEDYVGSDFAVGSYDYSALLHEIGHALGLDHSFREAGEPSSEGLPTALDTTRYSIMSYTDIPDYWHSFFSAAGGGGIEAEAEGVNPITPMMFDILVVQDLYGVSTTTRAGVTTYEFDPNLAALQTIFDSSGVDTWDLAGHLRRSTIDLRPASFSSIDVFTIAAQIEYWVGEFGEGHRTFITNWINDPTTFTWTNNVAIAYNTIIENVICGNAGDTVTGNSAANVMQGRGGADKLNGLTGGDTLIGGLGIDTLTGGGGADKFVLDSALAAHRDVIKDFVGGTDKIHLENGAFTGLGAATGTLTAQRFWANTTGNAHDASDRIIYNNTTGELFYDADGNAAGAKVHIATLTGNPALVASDFFVI